MQIEGYVDHIIYRSEESGYTVAVLICDGEELTCVGSLPFLDEGDTISAEGEFTEHSTYGRQFRISSYEMSVPRDELSIERYLASGAVKGIGAALAARIVRRFKTDTFRIMEEEPERLAEIKGISERKAREIAEQMEEKKDQRDSMIFLQDFGLSAALSLKIYHKYGTSLYQIIRENPYRMAEDIPGVGFRTADEIAEKAGILPDSDYRIRCGLLFILTQSMGEGHVYLPKMELFTRGSNLLGVSLEAMERNLMDLVIDHKAVIRETKQSAEAESGEPEICVYTSANYRTQLHTARMLHELNVRIPQKTDQIEQRLEEIEKRTNTELDPLQKKAVEEASGNGLLVITGGPGTGKTTTINTLIEFFESQGDEVALAAPTGRAAKRMTEATGRPARTLHRLLEISGGLDDDRAHLYFERNEEYPLEADVIIVDEMSMVDLFLMHALLRAVPVGTRLILVGDVSQLPSVGPGNVLRDIIASECVPMVRLTRIFRQASESDIVVNAHKINQGERVILDNKSRDFFFLQRDDVNVILRVVLALVQEKLPPYVNAKPYDIQVLTPMRKGVLGVDRLNEVLQRYLNPPARDKREKETSWGVFREGDKVMQIRNNYQAEWEIRGSYGIPVEKGVGIFNGDMGIISEINSFAETMTVIFDEERYVEYSFKELEDLELAYAITIHKAQGSEYPAVVIPLLSGPRMLMTRNLIYTAVTRARSCVTLVGSAEMFYQMVDNTYEHRRYSHLSQEIREQSEALVGEEM
ncbi:MAG: ATP-dependent RecD-like DNA helicase [Eubacteriales bacterium]|nr:ATP-dependent RecD-like DNA helicase [Eubacteriales bacterium]